MKKLFYFPVIIILSFISCAKGDINLKKGEKQNLSEIVKDFILKAEKPRDGTVIFSYADAAWEKNETPDISVSGSFYTDKNESKMNLNRSLVIDEFAIPFNGDNKFPGYFIQSFGNNAEIQKWLGALWGRKVSVTLPNSALMSKPMGELSGFYVPTPIQMESPFVDAYRVNTDISNTITWNPDPANPFQKVFISVVYEGDIAHEIDPGMPAGASIELFLEVPDNGSYTLSSSQLDMLPTNGRATIAVWRGNYEYVQNTTTSESVLVLAITTSSSGPIGVM